MYAVLVRSLQAVIMGMNVVVILDLIYLIHVPVQNNTNFQ